MSKHPAKNIILWFPVSETGVMYMFRVECHNSFMFYSHISARCQIVGDMQDYFHMCAIFELPFIPRGSIDCYTIQIWWLRECPRVWNIISSCLVPPFVIGWYKYKLGYLELLWIRDMLQWIVGSCDLQKLEPFFRSPSCSLSVEKDFSRRLWTSIGQLHGCLGPPAANPHAVKWVITYLYYWPTLILQTNVE